MSTVHEPPPEPFAAEDLASLRAAIEQARRGGRDPEAMRGAAQRSDDTREAIRRRIGLVEFAVPSLRAYRGGEFE